MKGPNQGQRDITSPPGVGNFIPQMEYRHGIRFPVTLEDNSDIAPPVEPIAKV